MQLPWWLSDKKKKKKNPPADAGDTGSVPDPGKSHMRRGNLAHVPRWLKPAHLEPVPNNEKPPQWKVHAQQLESSPPLATAREKPELSNEDPVQPKIKKLMKTF